MNGPSVHSSEEIASAVNLMAHPTASLMALSAVGFGLASQAVGSWVGAMSAAAEASQRFWEPLLAAPSLGEEATRAAVAPAALRPTRRDATVIALRKPAKENKPARQAATPQPEMVAASSGPARIAKPAQPDDLKAIPGVGPKLEQVLNGLGIWTYVQIAGWNEKDVAWVDEFLGFKDRIGRDGWVAQATALADKATPASGGEG